MVLVKKNNHFENVSLLITHYNRSKSLERLLKHFLASENSFAEIIVSDDGSRTEHLDYLKSIRDTYNFTLVTTPHNMGLGNNINKGQDAVKTEYTLYVQEDFFPLEPFNQYFKLGLDILMEDSAIDTVRFYSYLDYPRLADYKNGFAEMIFDPWSAHIDKIPLYSDHPHLRRSNFLNKFGRYPENKNPEKTEYEMMISFLKKKGRGLLFKEYKSLFEQVNTAVEPSTMKRKFWRSSNNFFVKIALYSFRMLKFNYALFFNK